MAIEAIHQTCGVVARYAVDAFHYLVEVARRVAEAVVYFFTQAAEFIADCFNDFVQFISGECCEDEPQNNVNWIENNWNEPVEVYPPLLGPIQAEDIPVDIPALQEVLRTRRGNPRISSRMTAADFTALCMNYPITLRITKDGQELRVVQIQEIQEAQAILDAEKARVRGEQGEAAATRVTSRTEFPPQRVTIGNWAENWANARTISIDPNHPFFEIFQEAFRLKAQIEGGPGQNGDYRTYSLNNEHYINCPHFLYVIRSLMGFQEFSREENRELMRKLDNHRPTFEQNPAYKFGRSLSKIFCYPTARDWEGNEMDVRDKLQIGIPAPMNAFIAARDRGQTLAFFQRAFVKSNICFDIRVGNFQQFAFQITHPHVEDFSPMLGNEQTNEVKIFEYFRAFKHIEMFRMANAIQPQNPEPLYQQLKQGGGNRVALFQARPQIEQEYCTKRRFEAYLAENGNPIRELQSAPANAIPPEIPFQAGWNGWIPKGFKRVPLDIIPAHLRAANAVVGVKDPNPFIATVRLSRSILHGDRYYLVFSRNRPHAFQMHNPVMDYPHLWMGTNEAQIDPETLPLNRRVHGNTVLIHDPATYRVRIDSIAGNEAVLDFRGDPIPRAQWEAVLNDDEYWTP